MRVSSQRTRERHPLLLTSGELMRAAVDHLRVERHRLEKSGHLRQPGAATLAAPPVQPEHDVRPDAEMREEGAVLRHEPDVPAVGGHRTVG